MKCWNTFKAFCPPQGPEYDEEEESELTVTELREQARKRKEELERRMMGESSDHGEEGEGDTEDDKNKSQSRRSMEDSGCSWGMGESAQKERWSLTLTWNQRRVLNHFVLSFSHSS